MPWLILISSPSTNEVPPRTTHGLCVSDVSPTPWSANCLREAAHDTWQRETCRVRHKMGASHQGGASGSCSCCAHHQTRSTSHFPPLSNLPSHFSMPMANGIGAAHRLALQLSYLGARFASSAAAVAAAPAPVPIPASAPAAAPREWLVLFPDMPTVVSDD